MAEALLVEIIHACPLDRSLDDIRESTANWCRFSRVPCTPDTVSQIPRHVVKNLVETLLTTLVDVLYFSGLPANNIVAEYLLDDMAEILAQAQSTPVEAFPAYRFRVIMDAVIAYSIDSDYLWRQVFAVVAGAGSPLQPALDALPRRRNEGGYATVHTAESPKAARHGFLGELPLLYVSPPAFFKTYFRGLPHLQEASEAFFRRCQEDPHAPLHVRGRWVGWDGAARSHEDTLHWVVGLSRKLTAFLGDYRPEGGPRKAEPLPVRTEWRVEPCFDIVRKRELRHKIEAAQVGDPTAHQRNCSAAVLPLVLPPRDPMTGPSSRKGPEAWFEPACCHARRLLANDHRRRFVMGFAMSGSLMRVWSFDRSGGVATEVMDIHKHALWFVSTLLGFLCSDDGQLGFDPTISRTGPETIHFDLQRENNRTERLSTDEQVSHSTFIAGRGTKVYRAVHPFDEHLPLAVKDSWHVAGSQEEGQLLRKATERGVVNVARYYHHETVRVGGADDDIENNVRKGLHDAFVHADDTAVSAHPSSAPAPAPSPLPQQQEQQQQQKKKKNYKDRSTSTTASTSTGSGSKRSATEALKETTAPTKRSRYTPPVRPNRVHRRVVMRDFGEPLTWAKSPADLLRKLAQCIEGHESLYRKGRILHRNVAVNNLLINSDPDNYSWPAFLCDLDVALDLDRKGPPEEWEADSVGTRAFMAIGVHLREEHTFMHDLESFFWVLFWVCAHLEMRGSMRYSYKFDGWNRGCSRATVVNEKRYIITDEGFNAVSSQYFTWYAWPMRKCLNELRLALFPGGRQWEIPDLGMYARMKEILHRYSEDPQVLEAKVW